MKVFIKLEVLVHCIASCFTLNGKQLMEKMSCLGSFCHNSDLRLCIHILAKNLFEACPNFLPT